VIAPHRQTFTVLLRPTNIQVQATSPRLAAEQVARLHPDLATAVESVAPDGTDDFEPVDRCSSCGAFVVGKTRCQCEQTATLAVIDHRVGFHRQGFRRRRRAI
jgi:hypothetical protein